MKGKRKGETSFYLAQHSSLEYKCLKFGILAMQLNYNNENWLKDYLKKAKSRDLKAIVYSYLKVLFDTTDPITYLGVMKYIVDSETREYYLSNVLQRFKSMT